MICPTCGYDYMSLRMRSYMMIGMHCLNCGTWNEVYPDGTSYTVAPMLFNIIKAAAITNPGDKTDDDDANPTDSDQGTSNGGPIDA